MPPISPGDILMDKMVFKMILSIRRVTNMAGKSLDCFTYSASFFTSYFVVTTRRIENKAPITIDSPISKGVSLKYGKAYMSAPVDIITGGINIFFIVNGRLAAFCLTTMAAIPMKTAITDAAVNSKFSTVIV